VAAITYFIASLFFPGIAVAGFGISFLWAGNVKRVSFGGTKDKLIYATGAMCGSIAGALVSKVIMNKL
jgi:hypothetical protein